MPNRNSRPPGPQVKVTPMQLKKRGAGPASRLAQHATLMQQDSTGQQLLDELESLTGAAEPITDHPEGDCARLPTSKTPALHGGLNNGFTSSAKRRRRTQLVSIFGSQDENDNMQQQVQAREGLHVQQGALDDIPGPSWPQQATPGLAHRGHSTLGLASAGNTATYMRRTNTVTGVRVDPEVTLPACELHGLQHLQQQQQHDDKEDAISDSDNEFEHTHSATAVRPMSASRTSLTSPHPSGIGWQQRQLHDQRQQQQQTGHMSASRTIKGLQLTPPHLLQQQPCRSSVAAAAAGSTLQQPAFNKARTQMEAAAAAEQDDGDWMPPKYRKPPQQQQAQVQHVQLPLSASKPAAKRLSASLTAAAGGYSPAAALGPGRPTAAGSDVHAAAAAVHTAAPLAAAALPADAGVNGPQQQPWWIVLEDFVPVEVLVQEALNPRDGAVVHINYRSQFKDGGTAGKRSSTAAGTNTTTNRKKGAAAGGAKGIRAAAAAAASGAGGFVTAGAYAAAGGGSGGRSKKGRKGRGSGSGSGSGKGRSSGGRGKKSGGSGGKWRFRNGRKVFIDGSGRQLTGSAAWGKYQQGRGQQ